MAPAENPILFTLVHDGQELPVHTSDDQYFSLMALISDRLSLQEFGLCSGMGSCGTCMVDIYDGLQLEKRTLSCCVQVNDELANTKIVVPERK